MTARVARLLQVLVAVAALSGSVQLYAQTTALETSSEATALFHRVLSPFCPGLMLADCPSPDAGTLRQDIKQRLAKGERAEDIERELYRTYGATIRATPEASGFGLGAWLIPPAVFIGFTLLALVAITRAHRSRQPDASTTSAPPAAIPDEVMARIEDELYEIR